MTNGACTPNTGKSHRLSPQGLCAIPGLRAIPSGLEDVRSKLRQATHEPISRYRHNRTGEGNSDAHLKRQIMGREVVVAITDGRFDDSTELIEVFGPWEQIFYGEFDGRRRKRVLVKVIGE